jgi:thioredoxin-dependent peroxiredoxin
MTRVRPSWLRTLTASAAAVVVGVTNVITRRMKTRAELRIGDQTPGFSLPGSDGRTYRLSDFIGRRTVVIAWFPKAFTGG